METTKLGRLLRERRTERGMSLRDFSEYLSISHAYLDKLEKGYDSRTGRPIAPTIEALSKISEGLELPLGAFLNECGYTESPEPTGTLELNTLADEFIAAVTDAKEITRDGKPVTGDREYLIKAAVKTLLKRQEAM
ncbi:MAG: helix-turn-helix domain-containing protein [Defluviitaleaceae bacterium]|nr:helix-turn-helix domain-containing protein [Defluviitaleaceae bacterium]